MGRSLGAITALVPGTRLSGVSSEAFVSELYDVRGVSVPVVDVQDSGLTVSVASDGRLLVEWTTAPRWSERDVTLADGDGTAVVRSVEVQTHETLVDAADGPQLVPIARLADGRTACLYVRHEARVGAVAVGESTDPLHRLDSQWLRVAAR